MRHKITAGLFAVSLCLSGSRCDRVGDRPAPLVPPAPLGELVAPDGTAVRIKLRPGLAPWQAAQRMPEALGHLRGASSRLGAYLIGRDENLAAVSAELLDFGALLPTPVGVIEVRTVTPSPQLAPLDEGTGCTPRPEHVGVYRAGTQTLLLGADGRFSLSRDDGAGFAPAGSGRFCAKGTRLLLLADGELDPDATQLRAAGADRWRTRTGVLFIPLVTDEAQPTPSKPEPQLAWE